MRQVGQALEQPEQSSAVALHLVEFQHNRRHERLDVLRLGQLQADCARQRAARVIEDEEVLVLVGLEGLDQRLDDVVQVGHEQRARLLFQGGERATCGLLHPLVLVEDTPEQGLQHGPEDLIPVLGALVADPSGKPCGAPTRDAPEQRLRLVAELQQEGHDPRQELQQVLHATEPDGAQGEDAGLLHLPIRVLKLRLDERQHHLQDLGAERVGEVVQGRGRRLPRRPVRAPSAAGGAAVLVVVLAVTSVLVEARREVRLPIRDAGVGDVVVDHGRLYAQVVLVRVHHVRQQDGHELGQHRPHQRQHLR
mmetsp:Transcript_119534/g.334791  ORF Transcript_119534/g.334791 Transcript_119534/m.334791 type:complete len:308 (+) Transcript_119534:829-1752(+)